MKKAFVMKIVLPVGLLLAGGIAAVSLSSAAADPNGAVVGQTSTEQWEMLLFGGLGNQYGTVVAVQGSQVIVGGYDYRGMLRSYPIPMSPTPQWMLTQSDQHPWSLATTDTNLYSIGFADPPVCGASDGVGGTEPKVMFAKYTLFGTPILCNSYNFFPYRGYEFYYASVATNEFGEDFIYAGGTAEQSGGGYSGPFVLAKYDTAGNIVNKVTEPDIGWGPPPFSLGVSTAWGLTVLNGHVYVAGQSWLHHFGEDKGTLDYWGQRPVLMKYDFDLNRIWKYRADICADYPGYSGQFYAVTTLDNYIYAVGRGFPTDGTGGFDFLVEKFDESGNRIWSSSWGDFYEDTLKGIIALGNRLFAVGYSYETPHSGYTDGDSDVVIFEINQTDGTWQLIDRIGGTGVEWANGVATDGNDLYIVGHSTSFASDEGNSIGELEIMLLHYRLFVFSGFEPPIDNAPVVNKAKAGSTIPVKWRITDQFGTPIADPASFKSLMSYSIACGTLAGDPTSELGEEYNAGASGLQYFGDGNWQFNWKTPKSYAGQCRIMVLTLADGSTHDAYFKFK